MEGGSKSKEVVVLQHDETIFIFLCAYSGGRFTNYVFVQFWDGGSNNIFFCVYSGGRFNSFVQFRDEVFKYGFSFASESHSLSPEDHRVQ